MKTKYISQFSLEIQKSIKKELIALGLSPEDIETAMSSRLCDLEDTIDITSYLKMN